MERDAVLERIYAEVASGRSLNSVLRNDEGLPAPTTFWRWHMESEDIRDNLARARMNGVEKHMDECVDIADDSANDYVDGADGPTYNPESVQRAKLRIETRLKLAQMMAPRKYGPKMDVTSNGETLALANLIAARRAKVARGD